MKKFLYNLLSLCFMTVTTIPLLAETPSVETWRTGVGDELHYDGIWYSFRSADQKQAFKIWVPPQTRPLRGLLLFGNPGGGFGGDTRSKSFQDDMLNFAARHGLAVGGVTGFPGQDTYELYAEVILRGLRAMAEHGAHPELAEIPMIFSGGSNAGSFAYSMASRVPERSIAITPNVGGYFSTKPSPALLKVPFWIHIGTLDALSLNGVERTEELFRNASEHGNPLWIWDAEMKGHENGGADHVDSAFWDAMLLARLPDEPGLPLKELDFSKGWIADLRSWDHRITRIFPASELPENPEPGRYGWIATEGLARLYQANATRSRPLMLSLEKPIPSETDKGSSGVFLSAGLSTLVNPGDEIVLRVDTKPLARGIQTVEIWDQGEKLGEIDYAAGENRFSFRVDGAKRIYALYAYASVERNGERSPRISAPLQIVVRDPTIAAAVTAQLQQGSYPASTTRLAREPLPVDPALTPLPDEQTLTGHRLDEALQAPAPDGTLSPLWETAPSPTVVTAAHAIGTSTTPVNITLQALWSKQGLYLLFNIADPVWSEATESLFDTLDFHLATVDPARLSSPAHFQREAFVMPEAYRLLTGAVQMQIPAGGDAPGSMMFLNTWNPWDPVRTTLSAQDNFSGTGIWIDVVHVGEYRRAVELFLPWKSVGYPGLSKSPPVGTRLAFSLFYQDPTSGATLAWPLGLNPWAAKAEADKPSPFGQLRLIEK